MSGLDVLTEAGQLTVQQELRAAQIIEHVWPGVSYVHTPKNTAADIDAMIVKEGRLCAIAEMKCRADVDYHTFMTTYNAEWLLTFDKMIKGADLAQALCVEFWGFLYIVQSDLVLRVKLFNPNESGWRVCFKVSKTLTQRTVNGGKALRDNAYVDLRDADMLQIKVKR